MELEEDVTIEDKADDGKEGEYSKKRQVGVASEKCEAIVDVEAAGERLSFSSDSRSVSCAIGAPGQATATTLLPVSMSSAEQSSIRKISVFSSSAMAAPTVAGAVATKEDSSAIIDDEDDDNDDDDDITLAWRSSMQSSSRGSLTDSSMVL
jgi:hypothetical protein